MSPRERLIAEYAVKISRSPDACSLQDVELLREAGFADGDILSLVQIIAFQNMSTRIMEALSTVD